MEPEYTQMELLAAQRPVETPSPTPGVKDIEDMTKAELQAVLDGLEIAYTANTNKADLIALINGAKAE